VQDVGLWRTTERQLRVEYRDEVHGRDVRGIDGKAIDHGCRPQAGRRWTPRGPEGDDGRAGSRRHPNSRWTPAAPPENEDARRRSTRLFAGGEHDPRIGYRKLGVAEIHRSPSRWRHGLVHDWNPPRGPCPRCTLRNSSKERQNKRRTGNGPPANDKDPPIYVHHRVTTPSDPKWFDLAFTEVTVPVASH
jgi:hypothetical protein